MKDKILLTSSIVAIVAILFILFAPKTINPIGSVSGGNDYAATTTDTNFNTALGNLVKTGQGTLGSVVISISSNAPLYLYDATSTIHTNYATTTLAAFPATVAGTYTFDVAFTRGLLVVGASTVGVASTTITSR